jgi:putative transposase
MIVIVDHLEIEMYHFMSPEIQFYASFGRIPLVAPMTVLLIRVVGPVLRRAVDQDGEIVDVFLQKHRDATTAKLFLKRLLKKHHDEPRKIVTDKLRSFCVAHRELVPDAIHDTSQYANNRTELSHQPTRVRERGMRRFKSIQQAQRFLGVHAAVYNLSNLGRHLVSAKNYRYLRLRAFASWKCVTA